MLFVLSLPDSHEDHAGSHVQTSNRTGDTYVHINDDQGPFPRTGCRLWLVICRANWADQWPGGRLLLPVDHFSPFLFLFELMTSILHLSVVLIMQQPFYWHEMFFFFFLSSDEIVCACGCCYLFVLSVLFCVWLCGWTNHANASQFIFLYSRNAIWYFYYTPCIVSFSSQFIYFSCKYIFC